MKVISPWRSVVMTASPMLVSVTRNHSRCSASSRSARFRSPMSRAIFEAPTMRPERSRTGEMVSDTSTGRPSRATRTVS